MFEYLTDDLERYFTLSRPQNLLEKLKIIVLTQGIWATAIYRFGAWCVTNKKRCPFVISIVLPFLTICSKLVEIMTGISIPFTAQIGKGLYIGHFGCIIIGHEAILGDYCNISQSVTVGQAGRGKTQYTPIIGNRVYLGPGAKVFGRIRVGDDVAIGANAVVVDDIPDNAVVGGNPAKILNYKGSSDFIIIR